MRELIINNQPVSPTPAPIPTYQVPIYYRRQVDDSPRITLNGITGNIVINPGDEYKISAVTLNPHLDLIHNSAANSYCLREPPRITPQISPITFSASPPQTNLAITVPQDSIIKLEYISGKVTINSLTCHLIIEDCPTCEILTPGSTIKSLTADLTGVCHVNINHIDGKANIFAHDDANILIESGTITHLNLATYGGAYTLLKVPVTDGATIANTGIHSIRLSKVSGRLHAEATSTGDIIIDTFENPPENPD